MAGPIQIDDGGDRVRLVFRRKASRQSAAILHIVVMAAIAVGLLFAALYVLVNGSGPRVLPVALFFVVMAVFAALNGLGSFVERDCITTFDTSSRQITLVESGFTEVVRGPVSFEEVAALDTTVGYADSYRSVIVSLRLANGETWRLGYDVIWVRPSSSSDVPQQIADLRTRLGFAGRHAE